MSRSRTPTLPYVLPMYETMRKSLDDSARDASLEPLVRNAAAAGLEKLEVYYQYARSSHYVIIATSKHPFYCRIVQINLNAEVYHLVLHPSLRLRWFDRIGSDFTASAKAIFEHAYRGYAESMPQASEAAAETQRTSSVDGNGCDFLDEVCGMIDLSDLTAGVPELTRDELAQYFAGEGGAVGAQETLLGWWKVGFDCLIQTSYSFSL